MATRQTAGTRAKDSDRDDTCQILDSALADGQLSMEEHRTRVARATGAETLGDLQSLISDLQLANAPVQLPTLKKPSRIGATGPAVGVGLRVAVAAVLVLLGIAIGWGLYGNTSSPLSFTSDPGAKSDGIPAKVVTPPRLLHSLGGLNGLLEQMRQRFGDTIGYRMTVYSDYAVLERVDPTDDRRYLGYSYRGGFDDPNPNARSTAEERLVDLSAFDVPATVALLRGAAETVGLNQSDVQPDDVNLTIAPAADLTRPDVLELRINVSSEFGSGSLTVEPDGRIKRIDGAER